MPKAGKSPKRSPRKSPRRAAADIKDEPDAMTLDSPALAPAPAPAPAAPAAAALAAPAAPRLASLASGVAASPRAVAPRSPLAAPLAAGRLGSIMARPDLTLGGAAKKPKFKPSVRPPPPPPPPTHSAVAPHTSHSSLFRADAGRVG